MEEPVYKWKRNELGAYESVPARFVVMRGGWRNGGWTATDNGTPIGQKRKGQWVYATDDAESQYDPDKEYIVADSWDTKAGAQGYCGSLAQREYNEAYKTGAVESVQVADFYKKQYEADFDAAKALRTAEDAAYRANRAEEDAYKEALRQKDYTIQALRGRLDKLEGTEHEHKDGTVHTHTGALERWHEHNKADVS